MFLQNGMVAPSFAKATEGETIIHQLVLFRSCPAKFEQAGAVSSVVERLVDVE